MKEKSKKGKLGKARRLDKKAIESRASENAYLSQEELDKMQAAKGSSRKMDGPEKDESATLFAMDADDELKEETPPTECEEPDK